MNPDLLTPEEYATALRVTVETVRRRIRRGELPAINVGSGGRNQWRISRSELTRVLDAA